MCVQNMHMCMYFEVALRGGGILRCRRIHGARLNELESDQRGK